MPIQFVYIPTSAKHVYQNRQQKCILQTKIFDSQLFIFKTAPASTNDYWFSSCHLISLEMTVLTLANDNKQVLFRTPQQQQQQQQ